MTVERAQPSIPGQIENPYDGTDLLESQDLAFDIPPFLKENKDGGGR